MKQKKPERLNLIFLIFYEHKPYTTYTTTRRDCKTDYANCKREKKAFQCY